MNLYQSALSISSVCHVLHVIHNVLNKIHDRLMKCNKSISINSVNIIDLSHVLFYIQDIEWIIQLQFNLFCLFFFFLLWSQQCWMIIMLICHMSYSVHNVSNETHDRSVMSTLLIDTDLLHIISLSCVLFSTLCITWSTW